MDQNNLTDRKICHGCLCTNRRLSPIDKYYNIFKKILGANLKQNYKNENRNLLICWECHMVFKNLDKFVQKVLKAQENFIKKRKEKHVPGDGDLSLTSLSIKTQLDYNYCFTHDLDTKIKIEYDDETKITSSNTKQFDANECNETIDVLNNYDEPLTTDFNNYELDYKDDHNIINEDTTGQDSIKTGNSDHDVNIANNELIVIKEEIIDDPVIDNTDQLNDVLNIGNVVERTEKKNKKNKPEPQRYKVISLSIDNQNSDKAKYYKRIQIDGNEVSYWLKKVKSEVDLCKVKCSLCCTRFDGEKEFLMHIKTFHSATMPYECDLCGVRLSSNEEMEVHHNQHYIKIVCLLCDHTCYMTWQIEEHLASAHKKVVECLICGAKFINMFEFSRHHKRFHKQFICDYCGHKFTKKRIIEKHMRRHHSQHKCNICEKKFKTYVGLRGHMMTQHVKNPSEDTFCVECNIQFDNIIKYKNHFRVFVKHRPPTKKSYPCPECGKLYNKHITMKYHYNYEHLKKTQFICTKCDRYFLNGFRLRLHTASVHDKISRPKNKICTLCGRGFSTNRILDNHIRTHTGERPFLCSQCPAAFAQKTALNTHARAIHKMERGN